MEKKYMCGGCGRGLDRKGCGQSYGQLNDYDYLADIPGNNDLTDIVEVQFKNTRKGYYHNENRLELVKGDVVAVEASPGHDIGTVTMTGKLAHLQMLKANLRSEADIRRVYRKVKPTDMEKYEEAKAKEHDTMIKSRQIAKNLGLEMKIGDVEYQGDGNKAIFYYIADGRVDFRQLIKVLAEEFRVRIEMKQIGARQEAGRIGGFGPCGRELCCATWMKNFVSVSTAAARFQDLSLNPQKLAGQCAKLKCCMNYEADQYVEASHRLPSREVTLMVGDGEYYFFKADILSGQITYSSDRRLAANLTTITAERAKEIIAMNRRGETPDSLEEGGKQLPAKPIDLATQDDLNRFDKKKKKKKKSNSNRSQDDPNKPVKKERQERPERQERQERPERQERQERPERQERQERPERQERQERPERQERQERPERQERQERPERQERQERPERQERQERPERQERQERKDRPERKERHNHRDRRNNHHPNNDNNGDNHPNNGEKTTPKE